MVKPIKERGATLIEILIAIAIITSLLVVVGFSVNSYVSARERLIGETKKIYLAEEGYEILRALRDDDWNIIDALTKGENYYLGVATTTIGIVGTPEVIDGSFRRSFVVSNVYRTTDDDIILVPSVTSPIDPNTVLVTVYVSNQTGTSSVQAILTNLHNI